MLDKIKPDWYVVNTYAGHENKVKENLHRRVETMGLQDILFDIVVAERVVVEKVAVKSRKKKTDSLLGQEKVEYVLKEKVKNLYPGYLFVHMKMTDESWYIVRNTPGVTGFIGSSGGGAKPFPVEESEIQSILAKIRENEREVAKNYEVKDLVMILDGPFKGKVGEVVALDEEKQVAKVNIVIFDRETPTDIPFEELKLASEVE